MHKTLQLKQIGTFVGLVSFLFISVPLTWAEAPSTPTLLTPANGTIITTSTPTFDWTDSTDNDGGDVVKYVVQYTTMSDFSIFTSSSDLAASSLVVSTPLIEDATYYWNVIAYDQTASSAPVSSTFTFQVNAVNSPPTIPAGLLPVHMALVRITTPTFSWFSSNDPDPGDVVSYGLYISTSITFSTFTYVSLATTTYTPAALNDRTQYYWKVDAYDLHGATATTAVYELNVYRVPAAPSITTSLSITTNSVTSHWSNSVAAESYFMALSTNSSLPPSPVLTSSSTFLTTATISGLSPNTRYYQSVSACTDMGGCGDYAFISSAATLSNTPTNLTISSVGFRSVSYVYNPQGNPDDSAYTTYVSTTLGSFPSFGTTGFGSTVTYGGLEPGATYYFRQIPFNIDGSSNTPSATLTVPIPSTVSLVAPLSGENVTTVTPLFDWSTPSLTPTGGVLYELNYSTDAAFAVKTSSQNILVSSFTPTTPLTLGKNYYWTVKAYDVFGGTVTTSTQTFLTISTPSVPSGLATLTLSTTSMTIAWGDSALATNYVLAISTSAGVPATTILTSSSTALTTATITGLTPNTRYFTSIKACNLYCSDEVFLSSRATLSSPASDLTVSTLGLTAIYFTLNPHGNPEGSGYVINVSTVNSSFSPGSGSILFSTSVGFTGLTRGVSYYFQATAYNLDQTSATPSEVLAIQAPSDVSLSSPTMSETISSLTPLFDWTDPTPAPTGGNQYQIEISTDPAFISGVTSQVLSVSSFTPTTPLLDHHIYYWRVHAFDSLGSDVSSGLNNFQTVNAPVSPSALPAISLTTNTITLSWTPSSSALSYVVSASTNSGLPGSPVFTSSTTALTTATLSGLSPNTRYYTSVKACVVGCSDDVFLSSQATLSESLSQLTIDEVGFSRINYSYNLHGNPPNTPHVAQLSTTSNSFPFGSVGFSTYTLFYGLTPGVTYYFREVAYNLDVTSSTPSEVLTVFLPDGPTLLSPTDGATLNTLKPDFDWADVSPLPTGGVSSYHFTYSTNATFASAVSSQSLSVSSYTLTNNLRNNSTYYWRIVAFDQYGSTATSSSHYFYTASTTGSHHDFATLIFPSDGSTLYQNGGTYLIATISQNSLNTDTEIKNVRFEYRATSSDPWIEIGLATASALGRYALEWTPSMSSGTYEIRGVLLYDDDSDNSSDAAAISVTFTSDIDSATVASVLTSESVQLQTRIHCGTDDTLSVPSLASDSSQTMTQITLDDCAFSLAASEDIRLVATVQRTTSEESSLSELFQTVGHNLSVNVIRQSTSDKLDSMASGKSATITLSYDDENSDGIIDNSNNVNEGSLQIGHYHGSGPWALIPRSQITWTKSTNGSPGTMSVQTNQFSQFRILGLSASPQLNRVAVYPNPFIPNDGDTNNGIPYDGSVNSGVSFIGLTDEASVSIYTISGQLVRELSSTSSMGVLQWDAKNSRGDEVASGGYLAVIKGNGQKIVKKVFIIR